MVNLWTSPEIADPAFYHHDLLRRLGEVFCVKPSTDHRPGVVGVHVTMVLARWLFANQEWFRSLQGPKVVVEHDAYLNFLPDSHYHGCWTRLYRNCNFDLIVSSGKRTTERLREEGLPAVWVPKGADEGFLKVPNTGAGNLGYFSRPVAEQGAGARLHFYESRHAMSDWLEGVVAPLWCQVDRFKDVVASFSGVVTNDATMGEPMAKQFECSALGAAVVRDRQDELYDLGYVEGESVVSYDTFPQLMEIVDHFASDPGKLVAIGAAARKVAEDHTWTHRAREVARWVRPYCKERIYV